MKIVPKKATAGMTLLELMVAVALLAIVFLAVMSMYAASINMSMQSRKYTLLTYEAELKLEELVGLTRSEVIDICGAGEKVENGFVYSYKAVDMSIDNPDTPTNPAFKDLLEVTITISFINNPSRPKEQPKYTMTNVINVGGVADEDE